MSGLDVASGIAGLISVTLQVSGVIAQYAVAVKDHAKNVKDLHDELQLLGQVLSRLNDFIRSEKAKGRSFEDDSVLANAVKDCTKRIERIGDKLKPSGTSKFARTIDRLKWPFEQKDVLQLVENLRRYTQTFEFALTIQNSKFLSENLDDANKTLKDLQQTIDQAFESNRLLGAPIDTLLERSAQLQRTIDILPTLLFQSEDLKEVSEAFKLSELREQENRKTEILNWISPISTLHKHVELQNRRASGTCTWLLEHEIFLEWSGSESVQSDMLCQGSPGVGKTVLCSIVADHLRTKYKNENVAIAYYYFDLAQQQSQTEYSLVRSILRQLCQCFQFIPAAIAGFYQRTRNELQDSLWLQELQVILQNIVSKFSQCFIVIDALDEIDVKKRASVTRVLDIFRASEGCVKFFITSRPYFVPEAFQNALKVDVRADENDLRQFLRQRISEHPHAGEILDEMLKEKMLERLCSHADGVFLLPSLQIDQILDQAVSPGDVARAIEDLSTDLREVFRSTVDRIESFAGPKRELALKSLMWLSHAKRPLRTSELQHAIAVRLDNTDFDPRDISTISVILDACCGLVELDGESACVKFVHGSIAQYFQNQDHGFFKDAELHILRVCLKYLLMDHLTTLPLRTRNGFLAAMESYPLLDYASSYWGFHAKGIEVARYQDLAMMFCNSSPHLLVSARVRDMKNPELRKWTQRMSIWSESGGAGMSVAAEFGLTDLVTLLISRSTSPVLDARNTYGDTPLHACALHGYVDTAKVLIAHGADPLDSNRGKATPFYLAVSFRQLEVCRMLLSHGRDQLDVACQGGNTALHKAADIGDDSMVEFLLQSGASINPQNQEGMTPLHLASRRGYFSIARMLVLARADVHATDLSLLSPLDLAALGGYDSVVQCLLEQGVDVNRKSKENWTPLHRAARSGHAETVKLLLTAGSDVLDVDRQRSTPFQLAVKSGSLNAVKAIFDQHPDLALTQLQHQDWKKDRAIHVAFYTSKFDIYEYLRDLEVNMMGPSSAITSDPLLPLNRAIENGDLLRVQEMLSIEPEWLTAKDHLGQTPLHTAFRAQQEMIAEELLIMGASINSRGYHAWTPLHIAASLGDIRMLGLALQWDADIFLVSETLQTPLHKAAAAKSVEVIIELMHCGCLPSTLNYRAMTPVHVAARQNFIEGLLVMIEPGFGNQNLLFAKDKHGRTAREWAERAGHLEMSAILRDEERWAKGKSRRPEHRPISPASFISRSSRQSTRELLSRRNTGEGSQLATPSLSQSVSSIKDTSTLSLISASPGRSSEPLPLHKAIPVHTSMQGIDLQYAEMYSDLDSD